MVWFAASCAWRSRGAVGAYAVRLSDGSYIYLKREVRGLSYDVVGLSANSDPCVALDPEVDYIYSEMGPFDVYYSVSAHELTLYSTSEVTAPHHPSVRFQVRNIQLLPLQFRDLRNTYRTRGISRILVPVKYKWCGWRDQH